MGEGQNMEEDGGWYQGNGALTATKSGSIRITGKPDKVGRTSNNETGNISSSVFSIQIL
jgi:hypothetical protein